MTNTTVFVGIHGLDMVAICLTVPRLTALGMVLVNKVCQFWGLLLLYRIVHTAVCKMSYFHNY